MGKELKAFLIYAYAYVFIYMVNSILLWFFMKAGVPPIVGTFIQAAIMIFGLYFAYLKVVSYYFGIKDRKKLTVGWLWQFIPFILISFILLFLSFTLVKVPSLSIFIFLNLAVLALYFTFKFSLRKVLEEK